MNSVACWLIHTRMSLSIWIFTVLGTMPLTFFRCEHITLALFIFFRPPSSSSVLVRRKYLAGTSIYNTLQALEVKSIPPS